MNRFFNSLGKPKEYTKQITNNIILLKCSSVNAFIIGNKDDIDENWALVDTGFKSSKDFIIESFEKHFGIEAKPKLIILTHGHYDHVGSVIDLANYWNIFVYAHPLEIPYLSGEKLYPELDFKIENGKIVPTDIPLHSIDLANRIKPLPKDFSIPFLEKWIYIPTPGHTEGHISLYNKKEGVIIVGDAIVANQQESFLSKKEKTPKYLTVDYEKAFESIRLIKGVNPKLILPSHGNPIKGEDLYKYLNNLLMTFQETQVQKDDYFI